MMRSDARGAEVIVVGGGAAGSTLAALLARHGIATIVLERDIHPRVVAGEALLPSTNRVFDRLELFEKLEDAGFLHRTGSAWNDPGSPRGTFSEIRWFEFLQGETSRPFSYHVERGELDTILLRHAHELGAKVLEGVEVRDALVDDGRAVGVRARVSNAWERDLSARIVVDASGGRVMRGGSPTRGSYRGPSWMHASFDDVQPPSQPHEGCTLFYSLGVEGGWGWQIPLKGGRWSVGVSLGDENGRRVDREPDDVFSTLAGRNPTFADAMVAARRREPFRLERARPFRPDAFAGPGWLVVGDTAWPADPLVSSGIDLALFSSMHAFGAIRDALDDGADDGLFERYRAEVASGIDVRRALVATLHERVGILSRFVADRTHRARILQVLQADPYDAATQTETRTLLTDLTTAGETVAGELAR